jgi:uncharacterized repeat protein (TIGR01451 family)
LASPAAAEALSLTADATGVRTDTVLIEPVNEPFSSVAMPPQTEPDQSGVTPVELGSITIPLVADLNLGTVTGAQTFADGDLAAGTAIGRFTAQSAELLQATVLGVEADPLITADALISEAVVDCDNPDLPPFGDSSITNLVIAGVPIDLATIDPTVGQEITLAIPGVLEGTVTVFTSTLTQANGTLAARTELLLIEATVLGEEVTLSIGETNAFVDCTLAVPSLSLTKDAEPDSFSGPGEEITYTLTATNDGNVTITDVEIEDSLLPDLDCTPDQPADLAPGAELVCTGTYTTTQADVDAGGVTNSASVVGDGGVGDDDEIVVRGPAKDASLSMDKEADTTGPVVVGDVITYTLTATNDGNVTITGVTVEDALLPDLDCTPDQPADLAPGQSLVCTGQYTVTEEDAEAGSVINLAVVSGEDPDGGGTDDDDRVVVPVLPGACPPTQSDVEGLRRLSGVNRVETAIAISQDRFTDECVGRFDDIVLARADVFADSLSGTPLAAQQQAPLLITASNELYDIVADEMQRVLPAGGTVYMLGGVAALDQTVEQSVADLGYDIVRLGGPSRFETAGLIAERLGDRDHVLIADGTDHSDALVSGTAAAANNGAVLLTPGPAPHNVVDDYLASEDAAPVAVGGAAATAYPQMNSLTGATREGTAVAVAEAFFDDPTHVAFARRDDFPDALGGGAHIGPYGGPLLLSYTNAVPNETRDYLESISPVGGYVYGGTAAIDEETFAELEALIAE